FVEQNAAVIAFAYALSAELRLFELEELLDSALQCVLESRFECGIRAQLRSNQTHEQNVVRRLHREMQSLDAAWPLRCWRTLRCWCHYLATFQVHEETWCISGPPAAIDVQQCSGRPVGEPKDWCLTDHDVGFLHASRSAGIG